MIKYSDNGNITISIDQSMDFQNFQGEDKDKDAWIYSMQASMFELAKQQGGLEPVKWDQMGYAGKFVTFKFYLSMVNM